MSNSDDQKSSDASTAQDTTTKSELETAQDEALKWKNEYLYMRAEFENYKRNAIKERSELLKFGAERMAKDVLDVMDNFDRALQTKVTAESLNNFKLGVEMTAKELREVLVKHGISEVPSEGQPFNPNVHEALSSEPTSSVPAGHITKVFRKPYKLHDKVIRTGQVVVAMAATSGSSSTNGEA